MKEDLTVPDGYPHDFVICMECSQRMRTVEHSHLLNKHNMTLQEYKRKWAAYPRICTETLVFLGRKKDADAQLRAYPGGGRCEPE